MMLDAVCESGGKSCGPMHTCAAHREGYLPRILDAVSQINDSSCSSSNAARAHDDHSNWAEGRKVFADKVPQPPFLLPLSDAPRRPSRHRSLMERRMNSKMLPKKACVFMSSPPAIAGVADRDEQEELCEEAVPCPDSDIRVCTLINDADNGGSRAVTAEDAALGGESVSAPASLRYRSLPRFLKDARMREFASSHDHLL